MCSIELKGGNQAFVAFLDEHFTGGWHLTPPDLKRTYLRNVGHNDHRNEPSHHIPYLYALGHGASKGQPVIRSIAASNYNATARGLSGVRPSMSVKFHFSLIGLYIE